MAQRPSTIKDLIDQAEIHEESSSRLIDSAVGAAMLGKI